MTGRKWTYGLLAGFAATVVLSVLMILKSAMGMMPQVNAIAMLTKLGAANLGLPMSMAVGWVLHFLIGTVLWGLLFAAVVQAIPGRYWVRGALFSIGPWILMMIIPMPMAGAGLFGMNLGVAAPVATLILHLIYGAVLGGVYGGLIARQTPQPV